MKTLLLSIFLSLTIFCGIIIADDAPMHLVSGGVTPSYGPIRHDHIKMVQEIVTITLGDSSYVVDATFIFYNYGKTADLHVGFPKRGSGYFGSSFNHADDFIKFETWVDGTKVDFIEEPDSSSIKATLTLPDLINAIKSDKMDGIDLYAEDYRWIVKRVNFPSKRKTTTRVIYEALYETAGSNCTYAKYIYGTGSWWYGNIGKALFIIDRTKLSNYDGKLDADVPFLDVIEKKYINKLKMTTICKGRTKFEIKDFKPKEDEYVFAPLKCDEP